MVRRTVIVSKEDRSEKHRIIINIGGGGSVPLLIPTPMDARCFDHSQFSQVNAVHCFKVRRRRHGALLCSVSIAVQTVDLPAPNRNLRHFDSV